MGKTHPVCNECHLTVFMGLSIISGILKTEPLARKKSLVSDVEEFSGLDTKFLNVVGSSWL